ncbi:MAG TPA: thioesterase family protein [Microbacteriaceae bacterium]|nr:thioesterase family protein [Microbacteriaceae bacterium]
MHMLWRTLLHIWLWSRRQPRLGHYDVARTRFVTLPTDLDMNRHMNNGKFFSIMDIARTDMIVRTGVWTIFRARGWYPVVVAETLSFRKSLKLWQRFTIESRVLGFDDKAAIVEQRFVVRDASGQPEIYARGFVRARFLKRTGGTVSNAELIDAIGAAPQPLPQWIHDWAAHTSLPASRAEAPSLWDDPQHG